MLPALARRADQRRRQREHQRRLDAARVGIAAPARRPRPRRVPLVAQLPHRGASGSALPPCAQTNSTRCERSRTDQLDERELQRRAADRERPREPRVLAARPVRQRRGDHGVQRRSERGRDDRVGAQRQVRAVLLGRAERHDEQVARHRARRQRSSAEAAGEAIGDQRGRQGVGRAPRRGRARAGRSRSRCAGRRARSRRRPARRRRGPTGTAGRSSPRGRRARAP